MSLYQNSLHLDCYFFSFQLEKENQDLLIKQEALRGQVSRLSKDLEAVEKRARDANAAMMQRLQAQEAEYQQIVSNLKKLNDENTRKLTEERVKKLG